MGMTANTPAKRRAAKALIGLLVLAGLSAGALTYSSAPARAVTSPPGLGPKIAFTRTDVALPGTEDSDQAEIWVMNQDGTDRRRLTHNKTFDLGAVWSPDGHTIAFYSAEPVTGPHIFFIPADGGSQRPLKVDGPSRFPSWSSQGKIAFDNGDMTSGDIYVVNPDGSGRQRLTFNPEWRNIRPDWSPDGQKIAFVSRRNNGSDRIFVMNADGSDVTQLTSVTKPIADNAPAWSPDGQKIAFQRNLGAGNGKTEIYTMNADGTDQTRLTNYEGRDQDPDWSPDGSTIAFARDAEPIATQTFQVFLMNADGSDLRQLTGLDFPGDPSENNHPGWGPSHFGTP
jgi:Tol biopolymer transport system component